jgi:prepilin-type N-terminal cleavage/methylation domain-containing protein
MKAPIFRRPSGFTLVELLVVMIIIASLAALGISGGLRALEKAKRSASMVVARGVESAVNNYFTEYGSMPGEDGDTEVSFSINSTRGKKLLNTLLGTDTTANTRGIKFLQVTEGKKIGTDGGIGGLIYGAEVNGVPTVIGLYDPWGGPYHVILDLDYDEKLVDVKTTADKEANKKTLNGRRVAIWSNGADGVTSVGEAADDVKTW